MLSLCPLTLENAEQIRLWRNADLSPWRTPYLLTQEMQEDWYRNTVCNRNSPHRFWAVVEDSRYIGMVGLTNLDWQNRWCELNLIMSPDRWKLADKAVDLLLEQAFDSLGLAMVCGECYTCGSVFSVWDGIVSRWMQNGGSGVYRTMLPQRKFWQGKFHESMYFSLNCDGYQMMKRGDVAE